MNRNFYCVIQAGGTGVRVWPVSRREKPKQFIDLLGTGETMIQTTYRRFARFIDTDNIIVVTNERWAQYVREQIPELSPMNLLLEPMSRNTLPSASYACVEISRRNRNASVVVTPCDHNITDMRERQFEEDILRGLDYVGNNNRILTVGVPPSRPEVAYGYIQMGEQSDTSYIYSAQSFTEKPEEQFANIFFNSGEFLWNTGIYFWNVKTFFDETDSRNSYLTPIIKDARVRYYAGSDIKQTIFDMFSILPNMTIESSLIEKSDNVDVMLCHFGWADLGTWDSVYDSSPKDQNGNVVMKDTTAVLYDCKDCIVRLPEGKVAVLQGLSEYVVVSDGNILVVCKKEDQGAIRKFVNNAQLDLGEKYL